MKERNKQLRKMMARRMLSYKRPESHFYEVSNQHPAPSKFGSRQWFKAKVDKKALPPIPGRNRPKDSKYAKMSIKEFEKKYL